jgi:hypothetical protein
MTPSPPKIHRPVVVFCLLLMAGCGPTKPPETGLDAAARQLAAARDGGAGTYAPLELRAAEDRLSAGRAAADKHDYGAAADLAAESEVNSELAMVRSRLGKARERVEARTHENEKLRNELGVGDATPSGQP